MPCSWQGQKVRIIISFDTYYILAFLTMCPLHGFTQRVLRNIPSSRTQRLKRYEVKKKNASNPDLERAARHNQTVVPVESINREWWKTSLSGRRSHLRSGM